MSRLASELRALACQVLLAGYLALAPSSVPPWRVEPRFRVATVLPIGEPTPGLWR